MAPRSSMAPHNSKGLKVKTKEVKIPHLTNANKKKMEAWGLGGLFAVEWNQTYEDLVEELAGHSDQKVPFPRMNIVGSWERGPQTFGGRSTTCQKQVPEMLNAVLAPVRPEHFQHNQLAFYHYAWVAINGPIGPTLDWEDVLEKIVSRQIKALGVCNETTCLGPYLAQLYSHFHEMDNEEKEDSKKRKALIQTIFDFDTKTEDEKEPKEEIPHIAWEGEASRSKPLDKSTTVDYHDWGFVFKILDGKPRNILRHFTWRLAV
ncbi:hypothetical protein R1flu_006002 [Riccia fluitans]|uniref:Uncharacterized protein n=1 Tax=Riccia fluitans TaxID=41844 RepID=A0ABD1YVI1_9MARC